MLLLFFFTDYISLFVVIYKFLQKLYGSYYKHNKRLTYSSNERRSHGDSFKGKLSKV